MKTSKAQRGPSVTYGPGKNFPHKASRKATETTDLQGELELPTNDGNEEPHD